MKKVQDKERKQRMEFEGHVLTKLDSLTQEVSRNTAVTEGVVERLDKLNGKVATLQEQTNKQDGWITKHDELSILRSDHIVMDVSEIDKRVKTLEESMQLFGVFSKVDWIKIVKYVGLVFIALLLIQAGRVDLIGNILSFLMGGS
jgi:hypothetical protein